MGRGFQSEADAKAARDQARVTARTGQYVDRNPVTVSSYLDQWIEAHAVEVKPKTLHDYRHLIDRHVSRISAGCGSRRCVPPI
jgi:integrase